MKQESLEALGAVPVWICIGNSDKVSIMTDGTVEITSAQTEPIIVHQGRYRLYRKVDGGLHLVYQRDDSDTPDHMELPAALLRLAEMAGEGKLTLPEMLKEVMKLRNTMLWLMNIWDRVGQLKV